MIIAVRRVLALAAVLTATASLAAAGDLTKEQCVDAHSRAQDARDTGQISLARKLFLTCAQAACPAIVQNECARLADDLDRQQPSMSFAARDASGADLPDTTVYVDDALIVTRLDDGKAHDADPGKHVVRFSNNGRDQTVTVVLNSGEKGRVVVATFPDLREAAAPTTGEPRAPAPRRTAETRHPTGAKVLMIGGGVAVVAGAAVAILGFTRVPDNCDASTNQCVGPPGDPSLADASSAIKLADIGIGVGAVGGAMVVGGLVWYLTGARTEQPPPVTATITPTGAGVAYSARW